MELCVRLSFGAVCVVKLASAQSRVPEGAPMSGSGAELYRTKDCLRHWDDAERRGGVGRFNEDGKLRAGNGQARKLAA